MVASSGRFYNKGGFIVCSIDIPFFFCGSGEFLNLRKFLFKLSVLLLEKFALFGKPLYSINQLSQITQKI